MCMSTLMECSPLPMDNPFDLQEVNGLTQITAISLLVMTMVQTYAEFWDGFPKLRKGPRKNTLNPISQGKW